MEYTALPVVRRLQLYACGLSYRFFFVGIQNFTSYNCSWKDIISEALVLDLHEFSDVFIDSDARDELLCLDEDVLQYIVDVVQIVSRSNYLLWLYG